MHFFWIVIIGSNNIYIGRFTKMRKPLNLRSTNWALMPCLEMGPIRGFKKRCPHFDSTNIIAVWRRVVHLKALIEHKLLMQGFLQFPALLVDFEFIIKICSVYNQTAHLHFGHVNDELMLTDSNDESLVESSTSWIIL